jgi:chitinase
LVGSAPQCPFPDVILGSIINAAGFDFVNVQFYNNYCSAAGNSFNYDTWANWAQTTSPNKNVKIFFTVPGSPSAAGSGYVPITTIQNIVPQLASQYPGTFGGVSVWDASQAWANGNFASQLYSLVKGSGGGSTSTKTTTTAATTTSTNISVSTTSTKTTSSVTPTSTSTPGTCAAAGQACSTEGKYVCTTGGAYAVCLYGKWSLTSCPSGTSCIPTSDGGSVYCGYSTGSNTCSPVTAREIFFETLNKGGATPKPYKVSQVAAQFTVSNATAKAFEAVINARRVTTKPFNRLVTIEFTAPGNVKFSQVGSGSIRQVGNKVRIQAQNAYNTSMSLVVNVKGSIDSGVFVAPNPASLRFK